MSGVAAQAKPLKPITGGQLRALHAIAKRRGLSHDQLRATAGAKSLKNLSVSQASRLIDRLQCRDHVTEWEPAESVRTARGCLRNATERQRNYISHLMEQLGWGVDKASEWLLKRHGIHDLAGGVFLTKTAGSAIIQLEEALRKHLKTADRSGFDMA